MGESATSKHVFLPCKKQQTSEGKQHKSLHTRTHEPTGKKEEKHQIQVRRIPYAATIAKHRPCISYWESSALNRSKKSPALSSCVATTVAIILAEPLTCAVYCFVNIAQHKHHSRVQAPVVIPHQARTHTHTHTQTQSGIYTQTHTHTKKHTLHTFLSHTTAQTYTHKKAHTTLTHILIRV